MYVKDFLLNQWLQWLGTHAFRLMVIPLYGRQQFDGVCMNKVQGVIFRLDHMQMLLIKIEISSH